MFSRFFIDRPIFAAVLSIFIVLAGLAAMRNLPIAQYPEIAPPENALILETATKTLLAPFELARSISRAADVPMRAACARRCSLPSSSHRPPDKKPHVARRR